MQVQVQTTEKFQLNFGTVLSVKYWTKQFWFSFLKTGLLQINFVRPSPDKYVSSVMATQISIQ